MNGTPDDRRWHLDRRVPIALIVTLLIQAAAALWWARGAEDRIFKLEAETAGLVQSLATATDRLTELRERVIRIEGLTENVSRSLDKIDRKLEAEPRPRPR